MVFPSGPTLGVIADVAVEYDFLTESGLGTMLVRCDVARYGKGSSRLDKVEMLASALFGAQEAATNGDKDAHQGLLKFIVLFVEKTAGRGMTASWLGELTEDLLADGYELRRRPGQMLFPDTDIRF